MKIDQMQKDEIDLALNESTINFIDIKSNKVIVLLSCISMKENKEFYKDNRFRLEFIDFGRIAISYRLGTWDDKNASIEIIQPEELKSKFESLILDSMYGWEFINLDDKHFEEWSNRLSLNQINNLEWQKMNTVDIFAEQVGKDEITIDVRIWFSDFKIFDFEGNELSKIEFSENGKRGWNQVYESGISTENHKTTKLSSRQHTTPVLQNAVLRIFFNFVDYLSRKTISFCKKY